MYSEKRNPVHLGKTVPSGLVHVGVWWSGSRAGFSGNKQLDSCKRRVKVNVSVAKQPNKNMDNMTGPSEELMIYHCRVTCTFLVPPRCELRGWGSQESKVQAEVDDTSSLQAGRAGKGKGWSSVKYRRWDWQRWGGRVCGRWMCRWL